MKRNLRSLAQKSAVQKIQAMIVGGTVVHGCRLPSERRLADRLGVSRTSLRKALSILETMGLVRVEPGRGAFVATAAATDDTGTRLPTWRFGSRYSLHEVYQFRLLTEGYAARLAAMAATDPDVDALQQLIEAQKDAARQLDLIICARSDFDLHHRVMQLGQNRILADLHETYRTVFLESQRLPMARHARICEPVEEHEKIVRALARQDPDGAEYYMRLHITRAAGRLGIALGDTPPPRTDAAADAVDLEE